MRDFDYSYLLNIKYDSETLNLIKEINRINSKAEFFIMGKNERFESYKNSAKIHSVESSNRIEGIFSTTSKIKQMVFDNVIPETRNEQEIMGYNDVLDLISDNYQYINIDTNHILQLHKVLTSRFDNNYGGKLKTCQNYIVEKSNGKNIILFTPVEPAFTKEYLDSICNNFNISLSDNHIDKLLLIFNYILDFVCIHPFDDGNGRTSRLLTNMLLYKSGFMIPMYISLERHIEETKEAYYDSIIKSQNNWIEGENNPFPFIKYMLRTLLSCYNEFMDLYVIIKDNPFTIDIVRSVIRELMFGRFKKTDILNVCPFISLSAVEQSLRTMVSNKEIEKFGTGKSTYYIKVDN